MSSRLISRIMGGLCVAAAWARIFGAEIDSDSMILFGIGVILTDVNEREKADA